jgi:hypothetical protein
MLQICLNLGVSRHYLEQVPIKTVAILQYQLTYHVLARVDIVIGRNYIWKLRPIQQCQLFYRARCYYLCFLCV